ncbi:MAG: VWA domain-containing protein [Bryobacteraceae bacterium]
MLFRLSLGLILGLALVYGGDNPPQQEPQMVDLNVVALDIHGQPVVDLTRDEFRVTDSGKPQTIAFFRHRDEPLAPTPTLALNEASNRSGANIPRATLILFDLLNERFGTRGYTANQLIHDLGSLESADYVYLYCLTLDGRLFPVHGLPGPEDEPASEGGAPWTRQIKPLLDSAIRAVTQVRPVDDFDPTYRVQLTYAALDAAAAQLSMVPGHKSIVWLTDGVPIELGPNRSDTGDYVDFKPLLRQMSEEFDRAGVSIYPVRQVLLGSPEGMGGPGTTGMGSLDTLNQFAEMTGGRLDGGKDVGAAVRQAITDMRTSYQIGYYPPASYWDDKYHKLRVTCTRKGVRIQTKTGYYAWAEPRGTRSEQAINSAVSTTFDAAEIGLRATLSRDPKGGHKVHLYAHISAHDIVLVHEGNQYNGQLRLAIVGYAQGSDPKRGPVIPLDLHLNAQDHDKVLQQGIEVVQDIAISEETQTVRLIVFDRGSNAIGSVTMPLPQPPPGKPN